ncbi:hypothetical protein DIE07_18275 [Burkholderia sp. Bp9002]|nr:hypothetical protein DIE07_18275 [Burkholderia sp. Bp9002]
MVRGGQPAACLAAGIGWQPREARTSDADSIERPARPCMIEIKPRAAAGHAYDFVGADTAGRFA